MPRTGEELDLRNDLTSEELAVINTQINGFQPKGPIA